jgi:hypothetical protein
MDYMPRYSISINGQNLDTRQAEFEELDILTIVVHGIGKSEGNWELIHNNVEYKPAAVRDNLLVCSIPTPEPIGLHRIQVRKNGRDLFTSEQEYRSKTGKYILKDLRAIIQSFFTDILSSSGQVIIYDKDNRALQFHHYLQIYGWFNSRFSEVSWLLRRMANEPVFDQIKTERISASIHHVNSRETLRLARRRPDLIEIIDDEPIPTLVATTRIKRTSNTFEHRQALNFIRALLEDISLIERTVKQDPAAKQAILNDCKRWKSTLSLLARTGCFSELRTFEIEPLRPSVKTPIQQTHIVYGMLANIISEYLQSGIHFDVEFEDNHQVHYIRNCSELYEAYCALIIAKCFDLVLTGENMWDRDSEGRSFRSRRNKLRQSDEIPGMKDEIQKETNLYYQTIPKEGISVLMETDRTPNIILMGGSPPSSLLFEVVYDPGHGEISQKRIIEALSLLTLYNVKDLILLHPGTQFGLIHHDKRMKENIRIFAVPIDPLRSPENDLAYLNVVKDLLEVALSSANDPLTPKVLDQIDRLKYKAEYILNGK